MGVVTDLEEKKKEASNYVTTAWSTVYTQPGHGEIRRISSKTTKKTKDLLKSHQ